MSDIFKGYGVQVQELSREDFLKVRETLARIGTVEPIMLLSNPPKQVLVQQCFVLHKRGKYAIMHAAELEAMDGGPAVVDDDVKGVRNTVAYLLEQWGLVKLVDPEAVAKPRAPVGKLVVVPFKRRNEFVFRPAYEIGKRR